MQVATGEVPKAYARQGGWRISVDRAWRSRQMRQTFEADTGTAPLDSTDERRNASGERSEEHTSELQSLMRISYAVFCLKKKKKDTRKDTNRRKILNSTAKNKNK